jgi:hypothetical protein
VHRRACPLLIGVTLTALSCGGENVVAPTPVTLTAPVPEPPGGPPPPPSLPAGVEAVLMGAGDLGDCGLPGTEQTASLLRGPAGTIITLGDHAYPHGSREDLLNCYDQHWGPFKSRTFPTVGNHDLETEGGRPYYEYFGANAGPPGRGYYSYTAGSWFVLSLNSELDARGREAQVGWVAQELAANQAECTLAYFHRPHVSSGIYAAHRMQPLVRALYRGGVDVIVNAHEHFYERFGRQDPDGRPDAAFGFDMFIVGTGGGRFHGAVTVVPNSDVLIQEAWGVIKFTLRRTDYDWAFLEAGSGAVRDAGTRQCHGKPGHS